MISANCRSACSSIWAGVGGHRGGRGIVGRTASAAAAVIGGGGKARAASLAAAAAKSACRLGRRNGHRQGSATLAAGAGAAAAAARGPALGCSDLTHCGSTVGPAAPVGRGRSLELGCRNPFGTAVVGPAAAAVWVLR
eukprot:2831201-Heterocapsa_arctica.AAC.1